MQTWLVAIVVVFLLQTVAAFLTRAVPIASPAFMAEFGWDESWIGYLSAANIIGAMFILLAGMGLMRRIGSVLALQLSIMIGAASLLLFQYPSIAMALLASALIGLSNGTANPAGSEVLMRFTPAGHHNLIFSIRQAGVPLGGVVAGLAIPLLIDWLGWRMAFVVSAGVAFAATAALLPFRGRIDGPRPAAPAARFRLSDIAVPMRSLSSTPGLWRIVIVGAVFSVAQSCWFTFAVTYLVVGLGYSLGTAGLVFAVMQAAGVVGRIALGVIADRTSSAATLAAVAVLSASVTVAFALARPDWPLWSMMLLAAIAGATVSGWNGVQVAETARRSPRTLVAETAAGNVMIVFVSNMLSPIAFAAFVAATGRFDLGFMIAGACSLLCLPLVRRV